MKTDNKLWKTYYFIAKCNFLDFNIKYHNITHFSDQY